MITVYSKPNCPQCESTKRYLSSMEVPYEVKNITEDEVARNFLLQNGHRSVPQIYSGPEILFEGGYAEMVRMDHNDVKQRIGDTNVSEFKL